MAKSTQKINKNDDITSTKIYELVRSSQFLQDLLYDVMSDIKEKPTYKQLKAMIEDLISKNMDAWTSIPSTSAERKRSVINDVSITAFTVDAIVPAMVYNYLQTKLSDIVKDICKQVIEEKVNGNASLSASFKKEDSARSNQESVKQSTAKTVSNGETPKAVTVKRGRGRPRKQTVIPDKADSDTESHISVGNLSVSSVHTSELSSFEDEISLSDSDDDGNDRKKRKVSLKAIEEIYKEGRISEWCAANLNSKSRTEKNKDSTNSKLAQSKTDTKISLDASSPASTSSETCGQKSLPQRIRKPNSKYSSDSIYCPIAEKLKQVNGSDEKIIESENLTPQKLEKSKKSEETKSPTKVQETSFNNERKDSAITPSQQKSSNAFKSHSTVHSLTSRKPAPVTLFSTVAKNVK